METYICGTNAKYTRSLFYLSLLEFSNKTRNFQDLMKSTTGGWGMDECAQCGVIWRSHPYRRKHCAVYQAWQVASR